jgi:hypothetical protein
MAKTEAPPLYVDSFQQCCERTAEGNKGKILPVHAMNKYESELHAPAALSPGGRTLVPVQH